MRPEWDEEKGCIWYPQLGMYYWYIDLEGIAHCKQFMEDRIDVINLQRGNWGSSSDNAWSIVENSRKVSALWDWVSTYDLPRSGRLEPGNHNWQLVYDPSLNSMKVIPRNETLVNPDMPVFSTRSKALSALEDIGEENIIPIYQTRVRKSK